MGSLKRSWSERGPNRIQKCWFPLRVCWDTDRLGMHFEEQDGVMVVRRTLKGGWADQMKLRIGDELVSINGQAVSTMPERDCRETLQRRRPLRLTFARLCRASATPKLRKVNRIAGRLDEAMVYSEQQLRARPATQESPSKAPRTQEAADPQADPSAEPASGPAVAPPNEVEEDVQRIAATALLQMLEEEPPKDLVVPADSEPGELFSDYEAPFESLDEQTIPEEVASPRETQEPQEVPGGYPAGEVPAVGLDCKVKPVQEEDEFEEDFEDDFEEDEEPNPDIHDGERSVRSSKTGTSHIQLEDLPTSSSSEEEAEASQPSQTCRPGVPVVRTHSHEELERRVSFAEGVEDGHEAKGPETRKGTGFVAAYIPDFEDEFEEEPEEATESKRKVSFCGVRGVRQRSEKKRFVSKRWAAKELGSEEADKLSKAQRKGTGFVPVANLPDSDEEEEEEDPLLDLGHGSEKMAKKAMRIMLQRMHAATMLLYLVDLQDLPPPSQVQLTNTLSQSEMAEIVLHEMVRRLARLSIACVKCSVPQKWIGSSVALGFDVGELTKRGEEEQLREKVIVSIFDWGRSELNTLEKHADLSAADQADRHEYWQYYVGGIMRLSLEVTRAYFQRFGNAGTWDSVAFMIYDFDSMSENDFMGKVEVPLEETKEMTEHVTFNPRMNRLASGVASFQRCCWKKKAKLTYSIEWVSHPSFSRLAGVWRVKLIRAVNLPREDLMMIKGSSDPLVEVIAHSADGFCFRQRSSSKIRSLNPEWNEVFEVPVTRSADTLQEALAESGVQLPSDLETGQLLPPEKTKAEMLMEAGGRKRRASVSSLCSEEVVQERKESGEMTSHQQSLNERKRKQAWVSLITAAAEAQSVTKQAKFAQSWHGPHASYQESRLPEEVRLGAARIVADTEDVLLRRENIVACDTVWKVEGDEGKPEGECCAAAEGCRFM
ncbi:unnamed protein product [Effrenium voratum]|nr:unnamed protein product [Effrenium voratum]